MNISTLKKRPGVGRSKVRRRTPRAGKTTHSEEILRHLEDEILSGALQPGSKLDEKSLAARFEVSRTPVREVLRHLASSGLVQMRPHHGAIVREFTLTELIEMFQVMAELEGLCARLAARRITPQEKVALRACNEECDAAIKDGDENRFFTANTNFHEAISAASHNTFLIVQQRSLRRLLDPYRRYLTHQQGRMEKSVIEHEEIIRAIEGGDASAAGDKMRFHVNMLGEEAGDFISVLNGMRR